MRFLISRVVAFVAVTLLFACSNPTIPPLLNESLLGQSPEALIKVRPNVIDMPQSELQRIFGGVTYEEKIGTPLLRKATYTFLSDQTLLHISLRVREGAWSDAVAELKKAYGEPTINDGTLDWVLASGVKVRAWEKLSDVWVEK